MSGDMKDTGLLVQPLPKGPDHPLRRIRHVDRYHLECARTIADLVQLLPLCVETYRRAMSGGSAVPKSAIMAADSVITRIFGRPQADTWAAGQDSGEGSGERRGPLVVVQVAQVEVPGLPAPAPGQAGQAEPSEQAEGERAAAAAAAGGTGEEARG
jgi:hypothetical protein